MKTTKTELIKELEDILPYKKLSQNEIEELLIDLPQFLTEYLGQMRERMVKSFPNRKDVIENAYNFVEYDIANIKSDWIK